MKEKKNEEKNRGKKKEAKKDIFFPSVSCFYSPFSRSTIPPYFRAMSGLFSLSFPLPLFLPILTAGLYCG